MDLLRSKARPTISFDYKTNKTAEYRKNESAHIMTKYADRVPVICEVLPSSRQKLTLDKHKYLVPQDLTVGQFLNIIRRRVQLRPENALYIFTEHSELPTISKLMSELYNSSKNEDGFLYLCVALEDTYGC